MGVKKEVFISYASRDRDRVKGFVSLLHAAGISAWMDTSGIDGGGKWSKEIVKAIKESKAGIVMVSPYSMASPNVFKEVHLLSTNGKEVLPLYLDETEIPEDLQYELAGIQYLNLFEGTPPNIFMAVLQALDSMGVTVKREFEPDALFPDVDEAPWLTTSISEKRFKSAKVWKSPGVFAAGAALIGIALIFLFFLSGEQRSSPDPFPEGDRPSSKPIEETVIGSHPSRPPVEPVVPEPAENERVTVTDPPPLSVSNSRKSQITYAFSAPPILAEDGTDFRQILFGTIQNAFPTVISTPLEHSDFSEASTGNVQVLAKNSFFKKIDAVVLGKAMLSFQKKSTIDPDLISCNLNFSLQAFGKSGEMMGSNSFRVVGVGFSNENAARNAMEKLMDAYGASIFPARG